MVTKRVFCLFLALILVGSLRPMPARANLSGSRVYFDPPATGGETCFQPGAWGQALYFTVETYTADGEDVGTLFMRFPSDWTVGTPTLIASSCDSGSFTGAVYWTKVGAGYELFHQRLQNAPDHCVATYSLPVNAGETTLTDASVSWSFYSADTTTAAPHRPCSSDGYYGPVAGCDETINPPALVPVCEFVPLDVQPETLPVGYAGMEYYQQLAPSGAGYIWYTTGVAPSGLAISTSGEIQWLIPVLGTHEVTVVVEGPGWSEGQRTYALEIASLSDRYTVSSQWFVGLKYFGPQNRNPRLLGDVNGDGKDDVVAFDPATPDDARGTIIALSTGTAFAKQSLWSHDFNWLGDNYYHREVGDVNGDGKEDVVGFKYGEGVFVGLSTGSGLLPAAKWLDGLKGWGPQNRYPRLLGDVNGDGMDDIVALNPDPAAPEGTGVYVSLSTGSRFAKPVSKWTSDFGWLGDNYAHRAVADVDGDGKDDIVGYVPGDGVYVGLSTGSGFAAAVEWLDGAQPWGPQALYPWYLGDQNADGKADIIAYQQNQRLYVGLSTGTSFAAPQPCQVNLFWLDDDARSTLQLGNIDGVRGVDLGLFNYGYGIWVAPAS